MEAHPPTGNLLTVSAPSGAGKTSLVRALIERRPNLSVSVSHTTRPMRPGEVDGVNYHFISKAAFIAAQESGEFFEWAEVFGHFYGTAKAEVALRRAAGSDVILEIDWQGARQVKAVCPESCCIFVLPPSIADLESRLTNRGQDMPDTIKRRMDEAQSEMAHWPDADYLVLNDDFDRALTDLTTITDSLRLTLDYQSRGLSKILDALTPH
ncbi:MAG: guanylate kinase [Luminiphilus sp.]|nr:guanylate kinase [Luminiphilus sp.]